MAKFERQIELAMSPGEAMGRVYAALAALRNASPPKVDGPWVTTSIGMSATTYGEAVAAYVQPGPAGCLVTIRSSSTYALFDWGRNKKNVERALALVHQPAPPAAPR